MSYEVTYFDGQREQCKKFAEYGNALAHAILWGGSIYEVMPEVRRKIY